MPCPSVRCCHPTVLCAADADGERTAGPDNREVRRVQKICAGAHGRDCSMHHLQHDPCELRQGRVWIVGFAGWCCNFKRALCSRVCVSLLHSPFLALVLAVGPPCTPPPPCRSWLNAPLTAARHRSLVAMRLPLPPLRRRTPSRIPPRSRPRSASPWPDPCRWDRSGLCP